MFCLPKFTFFNCQNFIRKLFAKNEFLATLKDNYLKYFMSSTKNIYVLAKNCKAMVKVAYIIPLASLVLKDNMSNFSKLQPLRETYRNSVY